MNDNNIEEFLRTSRPVIKDDPTFILETRRRLEAIEGIKEEVDHQRKNARTALLFALVLGSVFGILFALIIILFPLDNIWKPLQKWVLYFTFPAACIIFTLSLAIIWGKRANCCQWPFFRSIF